MDDTQRIVKCGNLSLHTPGSFFKKRWHTKYLVLYDGSKSGVKRLELFDSEIKFKKQSAVKIIPLVDCVRIVTCQRHKTTFTFEVRTSDQFYLLASKSFQDMNDWVNCLRFVAFGQAQANVGQTSSVATATTSAPSLSSNGSQAAAAAANSAACLSAASAAISKRMGQGAAAIPRDGRPLDVLLERRPLEVHAQQVSALSNGASPPAPTNDTNSPRLLMARVAQSASTTSEHSQQAQVSTASQAAAAAASALAKSRQRQPSLLGSCKPQPPDDSPFIKEPQEDPLKSLSLALADKRLPITNSTSTNNLNGDSTGMDTLTPTVRGQLISTSKQATPAGISSSLPNVSQRMPAQLPQMQTNKTLKIEATLDEEEENMLYCSIEDNPSEHNYRVKVIETELALRCQLKCYQLTAPKTISQQYEELSQFRAGASANPFQQQQLQREAQDQLTPLVTFYQLIIGPQELTLLNDYAASYSAHKSKQQQGLWSWPYQCIRRYGFDKDNCFMFEAGRKCGSGPGQFIVQTPKAYNIYQDVVKFVNELRTINHGTPASGNPASSTPCVQASGDNSSAVAAAVNGRQTVVTQIPVTWAPNNLHGANQTLSSSTESSDGHHLAEVGSERAAPELRKQQQQFFSQLSHQMGSASATNHQQRPGGASCHSNLQSQAAPLRADGTSDGHDMSTSPIADNDGTHLPSKRLTSAPLSSSGTPPANQKPPTHQNNSLLPSSRLSSASEETDESGYEQGDESVDSGPIKNLKSVQTIKKVPSENEVVATGRLASRATGRLVVQPDSSVCPSSSSSSNSIGSSLSPSSNSPSSSASSAANSPGQSVSRRTGETIQQEADRQQNANQLLIDARHSLNKVGHSNGLASKTRAIRDIIATTDQQQQQQPIDFEASLIRDVYCEITKLHAKFAVTSTGSGGDDSLSSHSRESSGAVSDRLSNQDEEDDDDDQSEEESNSADDGCYYMNDDSVSDEQEEPMYSNLSPQVPRPVHRSGAISPTHRQARRKQPDTISAPDKQTQMPTNYVSPTSQQSELDQRAQQMLNTRGNPKMANYNPPLSPQPSRPIYPTILNPIPEINEPSQSPRHSLGKPESMGNMDSRLTKDQRAGNISARARLALNRDAIKRQNYRPPESTSGGSSSNIRNQKSKVDTSKPTNHYVINDVQYAKILRSPTAPRFR